MNASDPAKPSPLLLTLAFAAVYGIWGSTYLAIHVGVETLPPFLMAGCRFFLAGSILYTVLRARGVTAPSRGEWRHAALAGFLLLTIGNGLVTWAEEDLPSTLAALLITAVPLYVAVLDWSRPGGQRPSAPVLIGIVLGSLGMLLLVFPEPSTLDAPPTLAVIAMLIAGLGWAAGTLYSRYGRRHPHALMSAAQQMIVGGVLLLLLGSVRGEPARLANASVSWQSVSALVYLIVFGSLVAFSAYGWLVVVSTPVRLSTIAYVNPLIAVMLGWVFLGEALSRRAMLGGALILAAVVLMTSGTRAALSWRRLARAGRNA
jgi:drug/metabolite transporter (DMT)-like permease